MTALSFVWVHPYSQNSGCDNKKKVTPHFSPSKAINQIHGKCEKLFFSYII